MKKQNYKLANVDDVLQQENLNKAFEGIKNMSKMSKMKNSVGFNFYLDTIKAIQPIIDKYSDKLSRKEFDDQFEKLYENIEDIFEFTDEK